jgi:hypothetical protein
MTDDDKYLVPSDLMEEMPLCQICAKPMRVVERLPEEAAEVFYCDGCQESRRLEITIEALGPVPKQ